MTHDVKLLPLPPLHIAPSVEPVDYPTVAQALVDYARANMEPLIAENERLRTQYQQAAESSEHFAARAERLAEALRWIASDDTAKGCDDGMQEVEAIKQRAHAALDQEGGNG